MRSLRIFIVEALTCVCVAFSTYANIIEGLKYEKIILKMDSANSMAGDTINVEGSLIDASNGDLLVEFSRYVYLDLISPLGNVECRKKLKVDGGQFKGYIPLPADCAEGIYTLAADYKTGIKIFRPLGIQTPKDQ